jgi:hypothetical protein
VDPKTSDAARRVLAAAQETFSYAKIDDRPHWAPAPCAPPDSVRPENDAAPRISSTPAEAPHGKKLYFLFAAEAPSARPS